jgi:hypothetical protein
VVEPLEMSQEFTNFKKATTAEEVPSVEKEKK